MPQVIDVRTTVRASVEDIWRLLGDSSTWPLWTSIESYACVQPGDRGVGEVRQFRTGRRTVTERVVVWNPRKQLSYVLVAGLAVREYRADVRLEPKAGSHNVVHWHTEFRPRIPGTGWLYKRTLAAYTRAFVEGLKASSESGIPPGTNSGPELPIEGRPRCARPHRPSAPSSA